MDWERKKCDQGHLHLCLKQEKSQSCGPTCAAMLIHRMTGRRLSEADMRQESAATTAGMGYRPAVRDVGITPQAGDPMRHLRRSFHSVQPERTGGFWHGTNVYNIAALIRGQGVKAHAHVSKARVAGALNLVGSRKPMIAGVTLPSGGGHFVLIDGVDKGGGGGWSFCICDPSPGEAFSVTVLGASPNLRYRYKGVNFTFDGHLVTTF
jgi:hypothetical protein